MKNFNLQIEAQFSDKEKKEICLLYSFFWGLSKTINTAFSKGIIEELTAQLRGALALICSEEEMREIDSELQKSINGFDLQSFENELINEIEKQNSTI